MRRSSRAFLAACAAALAFALGYALPILFQAPNLYYHPVARRFLVGERGGPLPMGYYGQLAWGVALGLAAGALTWALAGRRKVEPSAATLQLVTAWTLSAIALVGLYFTWSNWP